MLKETGVISEVVTPNDKTFGKLRPLAKINLGHKWGRYTQRLNFIKLTPLAKHNWGNKWGRYIQKQNFSKLSPFAKNLIQIINLNMTMMMRIL